MPEATTADLYLDLLKKALSFSLWDEPGIPVEILNYQRPPVRRLAFAAATTVLRRMGLQLVRKVRYTREQLERGGVVPMQAHTMIGLKRLNNLQRCVEDVLRDGVAGDLIETGAWRGGACILMRAVLAAHGVKERRVFVADSFQGLPPPDVSKFPKDSGDRHHEQLFLRATRKEVESNFERYGLLDDQVVFLEGWFEDTLPSVPSNQFSVIRLDGDMYQSTMEALTHLYPKLSAGGYCIIDDYGIPNCREAVTDYRTERGVTEDIQAIDGTGVFWRKR